MATSQHNKTLESQKLVCGGCQTVNSVERLFCGRCGQRLREPCGDCGTANGTDQQFCGHCGVRLQEAFQRRVDDIQNHLVRCDTLCDEGRYLEAMASLQAIPNSDDTRLQSLLAQVADKLANMSQERTVRAAAGMQRYQLAQQALASLEYERARELLLSIPCGLRDRHMTEALTRATAMVQETRDLTGRIRDSLKSQLLDGLLPDVNRLLELRPHDEKLSLLADQLRKRQSQRENVSTIQRLAIAKKLLDANQIRHAAEQLSQVSDEFVPSEHRRLYDLVLELDWLATALDREPFLHNNLLILAQRWLKHRPEDVEASQFVEQIRSRVARRHRRPQLGLPWSKTAPRLANRYPLHWWCGLEHVQRDDADDGSTDFDRAPGRFTVAYGLALQGLTRARLSLNLLPQQATPLLQRLTKLTKSAPVRSVWGCDLGSSGLKAMQLHLDQDSGGIRLGRATYLPHSAPLDEAEDDQSLAAILRETMSNFAEQHVEGSAPIVLGFSGPRSLGRTFEIPRFKGKKASDAIAYEARMQIPIPLNEIVFDWHAWPLTDEQATFQHVTLLAARRNQVAQLIDLCTDLPLRVIGVQSVCLALYNAVMAEFFAANEPLAANDNDDQEAGADAAPVEKPAPAAVRRPIAVLDLGAESSTLVVAGSDLVRYRSLQIGTHQLDRMLMARCKLTRPQAQKLRHEPALARWLYQVDQIVGETADQLQAELQRTLLAYEAEGIQIDRLLVTGGGSEQLGLLRLLSQERG